MILASASPRRLEILQAIGINPRVCPTSVDETLFPHETAQQSVERLAQLKATACYKQLTGREFNQSAHDNSLRDTMPLGKTAPANVSPVNTPPVNTPQLDILVAADTVVWTDEYNILGKPKSAEDALAMLESLSGKQHFVSTGVCMIVDGHMQSFVETTSVLFRNISTRELEAYVASGEPTDKAGAYGIQGKGRLLVERIEGDYFNVVGLPVSRLIAELGLSAQLLGA